MTRRQLSIKEENVEQSFVHLISLSSSRMHDFYNKLRKNCTTHDFPAFMKIIFIHSLCYKNEMHILGMKTLINCLSQFFKQIF